MLIQSNLTAMQAAQLISDSARHHNFIAISENILNGIKISVRVEANDRPNWITVYNTKPKINLISVLFQNRDNFIKPFVLDVFRNAENGVFLNQDINNNIIENDLDIVLENEEIIEVNQTSKIFQLVKFFLAFLLKALHYIFEILNIIKSLNLN